MQDVDAQDIIETFGQNYSVTRRVKATYPGGIATAGSTSTLTILAVFWPATGRDLQRLPELRRSIETRVGVTTTQLLVGGQGSANEADLITIDGIRFEVQTVQAWPNVEGFWQLTVQRANVA